MVECPWRYRVCEVLVQATHPSAFSCSVSKLNGHYSTTCEFSCDDKTVAACETPHGGTLTTCKIGDVTVTLPFSPC